jgi:transaldolase / glucose-6-phosphate isomerase
MATNPLRELPKLGQSIWYDQMQRSLATDGHLQRMIDEDDLRGLTSNPTIFDKAIGGSAEYDTTLTQLARDGKNRDEIYEAIVLEDIGLAADVFRQVYETTKGLDGYVSLEVSPALAHDTARTIEDGTRLFETLGRDNVMIKVPATDEGIPAIEELIYRGVNVNVTLIFSQAVYARVIEAYIRGLERRAAEGKPVDRIASVASFFVSRIDSKADAAIEKKLSATDDAALRSRLEGLRGQVAIANAKLAYQLFKKEFSSERWLRVRDAGAVPQRPLWASTGTKNPAYSDVLYVEQLIGDQTVNTVPPATYDAFRDHGLVEPTIERKLEGAAAVLQQLEQSGISLEQITDELTVEGVRSFADSFESLMETIEARRGAVARAASDREAFHLATYTGMIEAAMGELQSERIIERIWKKDATVWKGDEEHGSIITSSLGWLDVARQLRQATDELTSFAAEIRRDFDHLVLLGMGGSSLCAEVLRRSFGRAEGYPELHVLDSTVPAAIRSLEERIDLSRTLFMVASKSGTTIEPATFYRYFFERVRELRSDAAGRQFIAITDPDTHLHREAGRDQFRRIFLNPADIGGRYSALSYFGMVPAALAGIDVATLLDRAIDATRACSPRVPPKDNPGARLGAFLGVMANVGRDKMTLLVSPPLASLALWIEQLVAESTGKEAKGIVPISREPLLEANRYGGDRFFVRIALAGEDEAQLDVQERDLVAAGHPLVRLTLGDLHDLGDAFYLWEFATAVAGAVMEINPFDQPNVQESKDHTRELLDQLVREGSLPATEPLAVEDAIMVRRASAIDAGASLDAAITALIEALDRSDYLAIMQYVEETPEHDQLLLRIRRAVAEASAITTTSGYGPRFLHSTGQLHKGGSDRAVFLQIVASGGEDVQIPQEAFSFGDLAAAQAIGDFQSLASRNRRALSIDVGSDPAKGLERIAQAVEEAVRVRS